MPWICKHPDCNGGKNGKPKYALYAKPGEKKPVRCGVHKDDDMVDVVNNLCTHPECKGKNGQPIRATFAKPGEKKAVRCADHREDDMVDVRSNLCTHPECNRGINGQPTIATFAKPGEKKAVRCTVHKDDDMVNVVNNLCTHPECNGGKNGQPKFAVFAKPGEKKPVRCAVHKDHDMVNVVSNLCTHPGCNRGINGQPTVATFAKPGEKKAVRCAVHREDNMIDVVSKRNLCTHPECNGGKNGQPKFAVFAKPGEKKPVRCAVHKDHDMVNVVSKFCASDWCNFYVKNKYDGYCTHCFKNLFPNDPRTPKIKGKTKEELVREHINKNFEGFTHDKPVVWGGCDCTMRRRIDHRKLINGTMLAIETDEGQHKSYDAKKEENRYDDLFTGAHSGHWIFIRFNPDGYKDSKGEKRKGMFDANGKLYQYEAKRRLTALTEEIEKQIRRIENYENTDLLEIHKLFYDQYD